MSRRMVGVLVVCAASFCSLAHAETMPVAQNGSWYEFDVDDLLASPDNANGLGWIDLSGSALDFSFNALGDVQLTVVDAGFGGDRFQVFDNGVSLGVTSPGANTYPTSLVADFDAASANSNYSFATYLLSAGEHRISGLLSQSASDESGNALNATIGGLRVTPVPLPASALLFLSGGGLLGLFRRRRAQASA